MVGQADLAAAGAPDEHREFFHSEHTKYRTKPAEVDLKVQERDQALLPSEPLRLAGYVLQRKILTSTTLNICLQNHPLRNIGTIHKLLRLGTSASAT